MYRSATADLFTQNHPSEAELSVEGKLQTIFAKIMQITALLILGGIPLAFICGLISYKHGNASHLRASQANKTIVLGLLLTLAALLLTPYYLVAAMLSPLVVVIARAAHRRSRKAFAGIESQSTQRRSPRIAADFTATR